VERHIEDGMAPKDAALKAMEEIFPSAHVAGAPATAFGMRLALSERKWVYRALFVMTGLIAVATVYGR